MDIEKEIRKLRPSATNGLAINQWHQLASILDILEELNNRQYVHVNLLDELEKIWPKHEPQPKMKPCRFCGASWGETPARLNVTKDRFFRECGICGARGPLAKTAEEANDKWNVSRNLIKGEPK